MSTATVIVPSLSGAGGRLERMLRSLRPGGPAQQTIVVDNGSPNAAVSRACEPFHGVEALRLERNEGFSRAVNMAAHRAEGEALVLVNDDCVCEPGFVERIAAALDPAAGVAMAAGVLREVADRSRIDTAGMELDRTLLVFDYLNGWPVDALERGVPDPIGPCAAAAAFDREAFLAVGGFDEALFAYGEDTDLVLRLRRAGATCALAPDARGTHEHSATLGSGSARKNYLAGFGRGYLLRKWGVLNLRRAPGVLLRDLAIGAGQALIDRNLTGLRGRIDGWRAASPSEGYPGEILAAGGASSVPGTFRRRLARRARLHRR